MVLSLSVALLVATTGNLLGVATTSALFGSSAAFTLADWQYTRKLADLQRRVERLEAIDRDRSASDG
jgi:hypothetical protein